MKKKSKIFQAILSFPAALFPYSVLAVAWDRDDIPSEGLPDPRNLAHGPVYAILKTVFFWILIVAGIIALISFIISGIQYFLSAGDEKMAETAKRNMKYSVMGLIAALSSYLIVSAIDSLLSNHLFT